MSEPRPGHSVAILFARVLCGEAFVRSPCVDFQLNDEQLQLKKSIREFAEREIAPHVMEWDEACHFPMEIIKELGKMGVMGAIFPAEYGGAGFGYVEYVI